MFASIRSKRDIAQAARAVVEILYSALDYRGQQSLTVELGAGTHVPTQKVFDSFTPTRVVEVMSEHGQRLLGIQDDEEAPILRFRRCGIDTTIELGERCEGTRTFRTMGLTCELEPSAADVARLTAASMTVAPVHAPRCVRLGTTLQFGGGVAIWWFHERVEEWNEMISAYRREQRRKQQAVAPPALSELVH